MIHGFLIWLLSRPKPKQPTAVVYFMYKAMLSKLPRIFLLYSVEQRFLILYLGHGIIFTHSLSQEEFKALKKSSLWKNATAILKLDFVFCFVFYSDLNCIFWLVTCDCVPLKKRCYFQEIDPRVSSMWATLESV